MDITRVEHETLHAEIDGTWNYGGITENGKKITILVPENYVFDFHDDDPDKAAAIVFAIAEKNETEWVVVGDRYSFRLQPRHLDQGK